MLGLALSFSMGPAVTEENAKEKNVTEDQILRALVFEKKPLTRGLSIGRNRSIRPRPQLKDRLSRRCVAASLVRCR